MNDVYIAGGARTPMGGFQGSLSDLGAVDLGAAAIKEAVSRANLDGSDIEEIIIGCVLPSGLRQGPARQAAIDAGKLDAGKPVDSAALLAAGVISKPRDGVRILGKGALTAKKVEIHAAGASKAAIAAVEKAGGKIIVPVAVAE